MYIFALIKAIADKRAKPVVPSNLVSRVQPALMQSRSLSIPVSIAADCLECITAPSLHTTLIYERAI